MRKHLTILICSFATAIVGISTILLLALTDFGREYTLTFKVGNEVFHTLQVGENKDIELPPKPLKKDFTFDGWYFDDGKWNEELTTAYFKTNEVNSDLTVYAKFLQTSKIVSFFANDSLYDTFNFLQQSEFEFPTNPTCDGYRFIGWYYDNNVWSEKVTANNIVTKTEDSNQNVYAKFISLAESQTVTFYIDDNVYHTDYIDGEGFTMPATPQVDYYTFEGWYFDKDIWSEGATVLNILEKEDKNIKIYAKMTTEYSSDLEYILSDDQTYYSVKGKTGSTDTKILIPNYYEGLPVKEIAKNGFYQNAIIEEVVIGSNIEVIKQYAFAYCEAMTNVSFMENSKLNTLESSVFMKTTSLSSISIPSGIKAVPFQCFSSSGISSVSFGDPSIITEFGNFAFANSMIVELPVFANLKTIGERVFLNCSQLKSIYLPKTLETIGDSAFNECRKLTYVEMEDLRAWLDVDIIGGRFSMPWIYAHSFYMNNEKVLDLNIPEGVTEIKPFAFLNCRAIENITLPESLEKIGTAAFADVLKLKTLNFNAKNCQVVTESNSSDLRYPFENVGKYTLSGVAPGWKPPEGYKDIIVTFGENVENVPEKLFYSPSGNYPTFIGTINFTSATPPIIGTDWIVTTSILKTINVPTKSLSQYQTKLGSSLQAYIKGV